MKIRVLMGLLFLGLAGSALAASKESCDRRIHNMIAKLESLQDKKEKAIPAEQLRKAQGIILIDRTKAGIIFAYQGGNGVALVRNEKTHEWGPAVFVSGSEASLGLLGGGEQTFYAILLMDRESFRMVKDSNFEFGGKVRGTAGQTSAGEKGTVSSANPVVLGACCRNTTGFYGGAEVSGDSINPEDGANKAYYGPGRHGKGHPGRREGQALGRDEGADQQAGRVREEIGGRRINGRSSKSQTRKLQRSLNPKIPMRTGEGRGSGELLSGFGNHGRYVHFFDLVCGVENGHAAGPGAGTNDAPLTRGPGKMEKRRRRSLTHSAGALHGGSGFR